MTNLCVHLFAILLLGNLINTPAILVVNRQLPHLIAGLVEVVETAASWVVGICHFKSLDTDVIMTMYMSYSTYQL